VLTCLLLFSKRKKLPANNNQRVVNKMKVSSVSEFKNKSHKKVFELPSGLVVELCRLDPVQMLVDLGFAANINVENINNMDKKQVKKTALEIQKQVNSMLGNNAKQLEILNYIVLKGVSQPRVTNIPLDKVSDNEIHISDFGASDLDAVIKEVVSFSGFNNSEMIAQTG